MNADEKEMAQYRQIVELIRQFGHGGELQDIIDSLQISLIAHKKEVADIWNGLSGNPNVH